MSKQNYSDDFKKLNADIMPDIEEAEKQRKQDENSKYNEELWKQIKLYQLDMFIERELVFDPDRKLRFDFGILDHKIGIEIDGGNHMVRVSRRTGKPIAVGRHTQSEDYRKLNLATSQGWHVYRFTGEMVMSGEAINFISGILLPF